MAILVYSGPPGAGKSYGMVENVIVPAVLKGRTVRSNIDGLDPEAVHRYCAKKTDGKQPLGKVILFHGHDAQENSFWPTEETGDAATVVKGGDLIVFDEWRLYFHNKKDLPVETLEPFLRYHRHFTNARGDTCDVIIGSQLAADVHQSFRGLVEGTFRFRKLKSVGAPKLYRWDYYDGHLTSGERANHGNGKYKAEIYALYSSYAGGAVGVENSNDDRQSIWGKGLYALIGFVVMLIAGGVWGMFSFFSSADASVPPAAAASPGQVRPGAVVQSKRPASRFRIAGQLRGDDGVMVIIADDRGFVRFAPGADFKFVGGRPISGLVDGELVIASERFQVSDDVMEVGS